MKRYAVSVWIPGTTGPTARFTVSASTAGVALRRALENTAWDRKLGPEGVNLNVREVTA